jgi:signal transduction histidine kinase
MRSGLKGAPTLNLKITMIWAVTLTGLLWAIYRMRLWHIAREFERALQVRVAERARIARELHDTLFCSFNALIMHLEAASLLFQSQPAEAKRTLDSTIAQAAQAINAGREVVQGLRGPITYTDEVPEAIGRLADEISQSPGLPPPDAEGQSHRIPFSVLVEGTPRPLRLLIRDEVLRIAAEALRNAYQHSRGTRIEVELRYTPRQFRLRIRDDGQGIDAEVLASRGRQGHFGLKGMHERADLINGKFTVWSARGVGTELELTIHYCPEAPRSRCNALTMKSMNSRIRGGR